MIKKGGRVRGMNRMRGKEKKSQDSFAWFAVSNRGSTILSLTSNSSEATVTYI